MKLSLDAFLFIILVQHSSFGNVLGYDRSSNGPEDKCKSGVPPEPRMPTKGECGPPRFREPGCKECTTPEAGCCTNAHNNCPEGPTPYPPERKLLRVPLLDLDRSKPREPKRRSQPPLPPPPPPQAPGQTQAGGSGPPRLAPPSGGAVHHPYPPKDIKGQPSCSQNACDKKMPQVKATMKNFNFAIQTSCGENCKRKNSTGDYPDDDYYDYDSDSNKGTKCEEPRKGAPHDSHSHRRKPSPDPASRPLYRPFEEGDEDGEEGAYFRERWEGGKKKVGKELNKYLRDLARSDVPWFPSLRFRGVGLEERPLSFGVKTAPGRSDRREEALFSREERDSATPSPSLPTSLEERLRRLHSNGATEDSFSFGNRELERLMTKLMAELQEEELPSRRVIADANKPSSKRRKVPVPLRNLGRNTGENVELVSKTMIAKPRRMENTTSEPLPVPLPLAILPEEDRYRDRDPESGEERPFPLRTYPQELAEHGTSGKKWGEPVAEPLSKKPKKVEEEDVGELLGAVDVEEPGAEAESRGEIRAKNVAAERKPSKKKNELKEELEMLSNVLSQDYNYETDLYEKLKSAGCDVKFGFDERGDPFIVGKELPETETESPVERLCRS